MATFPTAGLDAATAACVSALTAAGVNASDASGQALIKGFRAGLAHGMPLDHTTLTALAAITQTQFVNAMTLKVAYNAQVAAEAAADAVRAAADAADAAATDAASDAIDAFAL